MGSAIGLTPRGQWAMVARHQQRVSPQLHGFALRRRVQQAFDSYARYWAESFRLPSLDPAELDRSMSVAGLGILDDALAAGNGAILAIPHLGAWDFGGAWLASLGYRPLAVVEALEPPELFAWFRDLRSSVGVEVVGLDAAAGTAVLRALKDNRVAALVCDRDIGGKGIEVDFFGERTTLPAGPATLALRTGAALLPTAIYYDGPRHHAGVIRPPLTVERTGSFRADAARLTQALASELEALIRRAPEQWHLFQPNWPSDEASLRS